MRLCARDRCVSGGELGDTHGPLNMHAVFAVQCSGCSVSARKNRHLLCMGTSTEARHLHHHGSAGLGRELVYK